MDASGEIWIDGFNLFYAWEPTRAAFLEAGRERADGERMGRMLDRALQLLARALGRRARRATVFLDGGLRCAAETRHGLRVRWAGPGRKADDLMTEVMRGRGGRKGVLIATNDRRLSADLRALGARATSAAAFAASFLVLPRPRSRAGRLRERESALKQRRLSAVEVQAWIEEFGGEA